VSFIKLNDGRESKMHVLAESACNNCGDYAEVEIEQLSDRDTYPTSILMFKSEEDAGQHARSYWKDYIDSESSEEVVALLGAETLVAWALGRPGGPGSAKVNSLSEWLDLYVDSPDEHFELSFDVEAIGQNLIDIIGFKPAVAYSMG